MNAMEAISEALDENGIDDSIKQRAQTVVWPIVQRAELGHFTASGTIKLRSDDVTESIRLATGCAADSIQVVASANPFDDGPDAPFRYGPDMIFNGSLAIRLWDEHWKTLNPQIIARVGHGSRDAFEDRLKSVLRAGIAKPLGFAHYDELSYVPTNPAGESLLTVLYYYLAYACVGDLANMARLEPLLRLMTKVIPIARLKATPDRWMVALLPFKRAE